MKLGFEHLADLLSERPLDELAGLAAFTAGESLGLDA